LLSDGVHRYLILLGLGLARSLPLVLLVPAFGSSTVGVRLRLALGALLAATCLPVLSAQAPGEVDLSLVIVGRELCVGGAMGFACACWFRAAESAGRLTDSIAGYVAAGGREEGPFGGVMLLLAVLIFLHIGGIAQVTVALARSYDAIPIVAPVAIASTARVMAGVAVVSTAKLIEASLALCAPVVIALLMADLVVGLIGRAAPRMAGARLGLSAKALLTIGVFLAGLGGLRAAMQGSLVDFFALMHSAVAR
jgi:type III secretory pathway component EscT